MPLILNYYSLLILVDFDSYCLILDGKLILFYIFGVYRCNCLKRIAKEGFWNVLDQFWKKRKLPKEIKETRIRIGSYLMGPRPIYLLYIVHILYNLRVPKP